MTCAMPCSAVPCCVMLCRTVPCHAVLGYAVLHWAMLRVPARLWCYMGGKDCIVWAAVMVLLPDALALVKLVLNTLRTACWTQRVS